MEVWLFDFGPTCPGQGSVPQLPGMPPGISWSNSGGDPTTNKPNTDCSFFTKSPPNLAAQPITSLGQLRIRGDAVAGGVDSVTVKFPDGTISGYSISDELLKLSSAWNAVEFNVFGINGGARAHFNQDNPGAAAVVHINVENGTTNAPIISNGPHVGFTGETNTFNLVPPGCANAGDPPSIVFEEITLDSQKSLACPPVIPTPPVAHLTCQEATEDVKIDQTQLANAQARLSDPLCKGPNSVNCIKTVKADESLLSATIALKNKACNP